MLPLKTPTRKRGRRTALGMWNRRQILLFIEDYGERAGYAPSLIEIAKHCGLSKTTVGYHVKELVSAGYLYQAGRVHRSLMLSPLGEDAIA